MGDRNIWVKVSGVGPRHAASGPPYADAVPFGAQAGGRIRRSRGVGAPTGRIPQPRAADPRRRRAGRSHCRIGAVRGRSARRYWWTIRSGSIVSNAPARKLIRPAETVRTGVSIMSERLAGKVAIVTGAGSIGPGWGNGRATVVRFVQEGARVFAVDRNLGSRCRDNRTRQGAQWRDRATHQCDVTKSRRGRDDGESLHGQMGAHRHSGQQCRRLGAWRTGGIVARPSGTRTSPRP